MSFPYHDRYWTEVADFLVPSRKNGETILAPEIFWWLFDRIYRYLNTFRAPLRDYDFVVVHKGEIACIEPRVLERIVTRGRCVFANAVFVVWSMRHDLPSIDAKSPHVQAFHERRKALTAAELEQARDQVMSDDMVLADPGIIVKFETLDPDAFKTAMNRFWENGGYRYRSLRDRTYYAEIDRHTADFSLGPPGRRILDLACGIGRLPESIYAENEVIGVDLSEVAIRRAACPDRKGTFAVMDAHKLGFPDASFDCVVLIDAIEHVKDIATVLSEMTRVVKRDGTVVATVANRHSLHEIVARKLGYPEFKSNYQHIREFTLDETKELFAGAGLSIVAERGLFLYTTWGIPLVDERVNRAFDEDPELVELMRVLGERVGPEHAYAFTVRAVRATG